MADSVVIIFEYVPTGLRCDIEVPLDITVQEMKYAVANGFQIEWKADYILKIESSDEVLQDNQLLKEYCLHDGSIVKVDMVRDETSESSKDYWNDCFYEYPKYIKNVRQQYKMLSEVVEVLPPESEGEEEKKSLLLLIMPLVVSLTLTILLRGIFGNGGVFIIYSIAMMTMSSIITLINYYKDTQKREEKKKRRTEQYLQYIEEKET